MAKHPTELHDSITAHRTTGEAAADIAAAAAGSWQFIWAYVALTLIWVAANLLLLRFDPYPFIFYTFSVSVLAILMSALILLAGNRQAQIDRAHAENAYHQIQEIDDLQTEQLILLGLQHDQLDLLESIKELGIAADIALKQLLPKRTGPPTTTQHSEPKTQD